MCEARKAKAVEISRRCLSDTGKLVTLFTARNGDRADRVGSGAVGKEKENKKLGKLDLLSCE